MSATKGALFYCIRIEKTIPLFTKLRGPGLSIVCGDSYNPIIKHLSIYLMMTVLFV